MSLRNAYSTQITVQLSNLWVDRKFAWIGCPINLWLEYIRWPTLYDSARQLGHFRPPQSTPWSLRDLSQLGTSDAVVNTSLVTVFPVFLSFDYKSAWIRCGNYRHTLRWLFHCSVYPECRDKRGVMIYSVLSVQLFTNHRSAISNSNCLFPYMSSPF